MNELYENGMGGIQLATVERLQLNLTTVLEKSPNNRDALTQLGLLLYGYATQPLATKKKKKNARFILMTNTKLTQPKEGPGLNEAIRIIQRGLNAGLQDSRIFRAYGLISWQKCLSFEALSIASIDPTDTMNSQECLVQAYTYLGRIANNDANARNPLFLITFARVCEANGDIKRALGLLGDMVTEFEQWEWLPHAVMYASNLCYHPDFGSELFTRGLQYIEWVAHDPPTDEFGWQQWELFFAVARSYQISGRGDLAAPRFRLALQTKKNLATIEMVTDQMLIEWLTDASTWKYMGEMYSGAGLNLYAADALAQSIHLEKVHDITHWLPLADVLRRAGAYDAAVMATAHAYELDRCNDSVRRRLHSWSPEWREMFSVESHTVTLIQSTMRRHLAVKRVKIVQIQRKHENFIAATIQHWWLYYQGLKHRRAKRKRATQLLLKIRNRVRNATFNAWMLKTRQSKGASEMARTIALRITKKATKSWREWARGAAAQRRKYAAIQAAQEAKVNKVLTKILRRMETKIFNQWAGYAKRSIRVKGVMKRNMVAKKKFIKDRWYSNVRDAIEERHMQKEPTVFIRGDDLTRRLHHADVMMRPGKMKIAQHLQPYVVGPGESWKRSSARLTAITSCLYHARKVGDTVQIPAGVPITEDELRELMQFKSFVCTAAPLAASDGRTLAEFLIGNQNMRSMLLYNGTLQDKGTMAIAATLALTTPEVSNVVLQTLGIGNHRVGPRGAAALGNALRAKHCTLTCLYLENNKEIGDIGIEILAEALETNVRLEKLVLSSNNVGDKGCCALADALKRNRSLRSLTLNHNKIGFNGFSALIHVMSNRNKTLSTLSIHHNVRISDAGAEALARYIGPPTAHIIEIDLSSCGINDSGVLSLEKSFLKLIDSGNVTEEEESDDTSSNYTTEDSSDDASSVLDVAAFVKDQEDEHSGAAIKLQRLGLCNNFIHGTAAKRLADVIGQITNNCALDLEGNPIDAETRGALIFDTYNKRIGSPRKGSPRQLHGEEQQLQQQPIAPSRQRNRNNLPSRAAMESLGKTGLKKIKELGFRTDGGRQEDDQRMNIPSFSAAGFTLKVLPPVKKDAGRRYNKARR